MIPVEVLTSEACRTLPSYAVRLLLAIAAQYRGKNNGDLAMTRTTARAFGVLSQGHLVEGISALLARGLIQKTRQGGKKPLGPCLYAVTWQQIDDLGGKIECGPTTCAANTWAQWSSGPPKDRIGSAGGPESARIGSADGPDRPVHRVRRRSTF
jgi:hypothetical protein